MISTDGKTPCALCGEPSVLFCDGCGKPLCRSCRKFDLWGYGCGHVDTKVFCRSCFGDSRVNPYGGE
ncbi:MAG: B-box zinc finger protein [Syntrophales bacterium]|nr:B-box zinc finger protein [Syntrophales bacterium]MDD5232538.1 B-box zinc finger protein [Syntrophales bacterium]MDD5532096.1 B-box zinc finger protein [Syntrophales bacterium]HPL63380.1 B-box zinc finger protein [Syntrophales bacterium]